MADVLTQYHPWIKHPLICSAPMRGSAGPLLATTVTAAGGIGFMGSLGNKAKDVPNFDEVRRLLRDQQISTNSSGVLPIGLGFLCMASDLDDAAAVVQEYKPTAVWLFSAHRLEDFATWTNKIRSVSDTKIWIQIGCVSHALELARTCKPDTLVLQGIDAGGHGAEKGAGVITLIPEAADRLIDEGFGHIPLIAAGGIVDHRGVAASVALGASGVTMGTRFLASKEVNVPHPAWQEAVLAAQDGGQSTLKAKIFDDMEPSIKWPSWFDGRALRNNTSRDWEAGIANDENMKSYQAAKEKDSKGFAPGDPRATIWAGTGIGLVKSILPAGQVVQETREAAIDLLKKIAPNL